MTFKSHSRSSAMSSFVRSHGLTIRDRKSRLHLFSDKSWRNGLDCRSVSLATAQFSRPHIFY